MAAYAAVLSLTFTIKQILQHPSPPMSLDDQQLLHSLTANLSFLQNFLEDYSKEEDELERRIVGAAYVAEDVIESHIIDQIHAGSTSDDENVSSTDFYQGLEKVIHNMNLIKKEVMQIVKEKKGGQHHQLMISTNSSVSIGPVKHISRMQNNIMMDFGDILVDVLDKLTREHNLEVVPIVGMGGIGKTTLARIIYAHPLIVQHFDILAWVTISQTYSVPHILSQVLSDESKGDPIGKVHEIGERVHKKLWGRRYLIVMDDIWNIEAWNKIKSFFPNNNDGSRIVITTRISNLAFQLSSTHDFNMKFLDDDKSWDLLCETVFGKEGCPIELENIGKEIARSCKGLPLSIVVIGGLLTKSNMTHEYWEYALRNLTSLINLDNKEHCLQTLRTSYKELPIHLKPCFLYMGIFPEDYIIYVPKLIKMCVAEGFLKPIENKTLEEVAKEYIKELIDRNLISVHELRWNGEPKSCKIHDLLRDLCLREARKERFFCVLRGEEDVNIPEDINTQRRICIHFNIRELFPPQIIHDEESTSLIRSLILFSSGSCRPQSPSSYRLLRVCSCFEYINSFYSGIGYAEPLFKKSSLRYLSMGRLLKCDSLPSSWYLLWNLQTLEFVRSEKEPAATAPSEIWKMCHLRHVLVPKLKLPNPPCGEEEIVLENLQTLSCIYNFKISEEVVKRIPNIKKLKLYYYGTGVEKDDLPSFCLNNLCRLRNLTSLSLEIYSASFDPKRRQYVVSLPDSLKKLSLSNTKLLWEDLNTKIGSLPLLQVLQLLDDACIGSEWETIEGKFCSLKFLQIARSEYLRCWTTNYTHFPRLEHLVLKDLSRLKYIPLNVGDIPTLQSIKLKACLKSVNAAAEKIKEEQLSYGNQDLHIRIGAPWEILHP